MLKAEKIKFIGNKNIAEQLKKATQQGRGHGFLLHGPEHLGKRTFAEILAREILNTKELATHPDALVIAPDPDKANPQITVEQAREVRKFLSLTPSVASRKVVLIDDADTMNVSSSNALLKVLEEPRGDAVIFLIAHDVGNVLPTIRSRALPVRFTLVSENEMSSVIDNVEAVKISDGRPGLAITLSNDGEGLSALKRRREAILKLLNAPEITRLAYVARAQKAVGSAIYELPKQWLPVLRHALHDTNDAKVASRLIRELFYAEKKFQHKALRPELIIEAALLSV